MCTPRLQARAVATAADEVEPVRIDDEAVLTGHGRRGTVDLAFEITGHGEVGDGATVAADEVVMVVTGEILGQFEVAVFVRGDDAADDARLLEFGQVAVRTALRQVGLASEDLGQRHRPANARQHVDDRATRPGVALSDGS